MGGDELQVLQRKKEKKLILVLTFLFDMRNPIRKQNPVKSGSMLPLQLVASF